MATATIARAAIVLGGLILAGAAVSMGAAVRLGRTDPALAARVAPYDARAATAAAQAAVEGGASVQAPRVRALVRRALFRDVTMPSAIELRALDANLAGDGRREAQLFELSDAISRRSLPTRLWLIQRSVDRGDVAGALEDFDIALRTSSNAPKVLFPVLSRAASDPTLAVPIARVLDRPEDWRVMFLNYAITQAHAGEGVSEVVLRMRDRKAITDNGIDAALVGELVAEQDFPAARRVHDAFHGSARRTLVSDETFSDPKPDFPFGWRLADGGDFGAERTAAGLAYRSLPERAGQVAGQLLTLPPGDYRLSAKTATAADATALPYWTLTCANPSGQIARLDQPASGTAAVDFTVPVACAGEWLALTLRPSEAANQGSVATVSVAPR